jgi:hypothetical protein
MKRSLFPKILGALVIATLVPVKLLAGPGGKNAGPEPWRIYDLASRNVIKNPDYREPAREGRATAPRVRATKDSRYYNPQTQQFEDTENVRAPRKVERRTSPR